MLNLTKAQRAHVRLGLNVRRRRADLSNLTPSDAKEKQLWKYPGGNVIRAPSIHLDPTDKVYRDPKEPPGINLPRRQQESNFFITINTNKSPRDAGVTLQVAASAADETLYELSQDAALAEWMEFGKGRKGNAEFSGDRYEYVVADVDWTPSVEFGPHFHRLHAHVDARFIHYSQMRVNLKALQYAFRAAFNSKWPPKHPMRLEGLPYVHVDIRDQDNAKMITAQYLIKDRLHASKF